MKKIRINFFTASEVLIMPQLRGAQDRVPGVVYSFLASQNGDVYIGIAHEHGALICVHEYQQWRIAVEPSKDPPLRRCGCRQVRLGSRAHPWDQSVFVVITQIVITEAVRVILLDI